MTQHERRLAMTATTKRIRRIRLLLASELSGYDISESLWKGSPMPHIRTKARLAVVAALGVTLAACSAGGTTSTAAAPSTAATTACPSAATPAGQGGQGAGQGARPNLTAATTVASSDTSTSIVLDGSGPSIQCGRVALTSHNDVQYDTTPGGRQLRFDVQVPDTPGPKPLVVYLTGGGFQSDNKTGNLDQRTYVAEQGFVVASIEYRVIDDGATYKETVADVKSAIRYLRAHAGEYSIDLNEVAVWGQSAGGYLAAMTGATNGLSQFEGTGNPGQSSAVQAVVDQFGPSNFAKLAADFDTAMQDAMYAPGGFLAQYSIGTDTKQSVLDDPAAVTAADPSTYVTSSSPPFALLHGSADNLVSPSQTLLVHNAIRAKGGESTRFVVQNAGHGDLNVLSGDTNAAKPWSSEQVVGHIASFLKDSLG